MEKGETRRTPAQREEKKEEETRKNGRILPLKWKLVSKPRYNRIRTERNTIQMKLRIDVNICFGKEPILYTP